MILIVGIIIGMLENGTISIMGHLCVSHNEMPALWVAFICLYCKPGVFISFPEFFDSACK